MAIKTLGDITRHHRQEQPDAQAMLYTADNRSWTFRELDEEANRIAQALLALGIKPQERVAYLDKNAYREGARHCFSASA